MRSRHRLVLIRSARLMVLGATLASAREAGARCAIEPLELAFSYPNETTEAVPPDAVLWLVPKPGAIRVRLDGVELEPVGESPAEKFQFRPPAPLTLGEHRLDATLTPVLITDEQPPRDVELTFTVAELPPVAGDVGSLEAYRAMSGEPRPEFPSGCLNVAALTFGCDDIASPAEDWLTFAPVGAPLAYLVNGVRIVPVGCDQSNFNVWQPEVAVDHEVAAVLPTGLAQARVVQSSAAGPSEAAPLEGSGCTLGPSRSVAAPPWLAGVVLAALALFRCRSRRPGWRDRRPRCWTGSRSSLA